MGVFSSTDNVCGRNGKETSWSYRNGFQTLLYHCLHMSIHPLSGLSSINLGNIAPLKAVQRLRFQDSWNALWPWYTKNTNSQLSCNSHPSLWTCIPEIQRNSSPKPRKSWLTALKAAELSSGTIHSIQCYGEKYSHILCRNHQFRASCPAPINFLVQTIKQKRAQ